MIGFRVPIIGCRCRCGHSWMPRYPDRRPYRCPRCKAEDFDRDGPQHRVNSNGEWTRQRIAKCLMQHGPQRLNRIAGLTGLSMRTVQWAIRYSIGAARWFEKTGEGYCDPWRLTEAGRQRAA